MGGAISIPNPEKLMKKVAMDILNFLIDNFLVTPLAACVAFCEFIGIATVRFFIYLMYVIVGAFMYIGAEVATNVLRAKSMGLRIRKASLAVSACEEDPRAWFINQNYHKGNCHKRMGLCYGVCPPGYAPKAGVLCEMQSFGRPRFCPRASVVRIFEGETLLGPVRPSGDPGGYYEDCASFGDDYTTLVSDICAMPEATSPSEKLRVACYDALCRAGKGKRHPACSSLGGASPRASSGVRRAVAGSIVPLCAAPLLLYYVQAHAYGRHSMSLLHGQLGLLGNMNQLG